MQREMRLETNKIRMAYIESELAKRHQRDMPTEDISQDSRPANETVDRQSDPRFLQREPASLGKLHEIDLGDEAKLENIARTEAATRRLVGEAPPSPTEEAPQKKARDGKSWRNRKRRTSEDIERDRLVEEVLRESRRECSSSPADVCRACKCLTVIFQLMYMRNLKNRANQMIKLLMTGSRSNFVETFLMRYRVAVAVRGRSLRKLQSRNRPRDRNWVAAGVPGLLCGSCRKKVKSDGNWICSTRVHCGPESGQYSSTKVRSRPFVYP